MPRVLQSMAAAVGAVTASARQTGIGWIGLDGLVGGRNGVKFVNCRVLRVTTTTTKRERFGSAENRHQSTNQPINQ